MLLPFAARAILAAPFFFSTSLLHFAALGRPAPNFASKKSDKQKKKKKFFASNFATPSGQHPGGTCPPPSIRY
jgi:hypothetical protein